MTKRLIRKILTPKEKNCLPSIGNEERETQGFGVRVKESEFIVKYNCLYGILGRLVMFHYNDWVKNHINTPLRCTVQLLQAADREGTRWSGVQEHVAAMGSLPAGVLGWGGIM